MSTEVEDNGIPFDINIGKASSEQRVVKNIMRISGDHKNHLPLDMSSTVLRTDTRRKHSLISSSGGGSGWTNKETPLDLEAIMSRVPEIGSILAEGETKDIINDFENDLLQNDTNFTLGNIAGDIFSSVSTIAPPHSEWSAAEIGAVTIVILMVPFILCSNLLVILSVVRYRRLHTPTNYFVTSLAAVDVLVALAVPFVVIIEVFHFGGADGPRDVVLCLLPNRVLMMACGVSVLTLATIAYDRHTALVSPLEYVNIMTTRKVAVMVAVTWIYSALIVWLPLMIGWFSDPSEIAPCSSNLLNGKAAVLFLGAIFVPSCIAILVCYSRIFLVARHHAKAIAAVEFAIHRNLQVKFMIKDTKYAKTLALVIGFFLILWFPYLIYIFIQTVCPVRYDIWIQTYLILLAVFNSGINPWIYAFKNNEFRAAFKRMFKELCKDRLCAAVDRRASLVPAVSTTPRLSRTDSRMLSNLLESTLDILTEQLKSSINSLNDSAGDGKLYDTACLKSNTNVPDDEALVSPVPSMKKLVRHTASCCDLDSYTEVEPKKGDSHKFSRSYSLDFGLTHHSLVDIASQDCSVGDKPDHANISNSDSNICDVSSPAGHISQLELRTDKVLPSISLIDELSSRLYMSSSSNINITSQTISSTSHTNTNPSYTNSSTSKTNTPTSHATCSQTSMLTLQAATLPLAAVGAYTSPYYPQHPHSSSSTHSCHTLHPTHISSSSAPQPSATPSHSPTHAQCETKHIHSFSYINENPHTPEDSSTFMASTLHCPQNVLDQTLDNHQIIAHTHSCPTFDPLTSDPSRVLSYWERNMLCSYLGTLGIPENAHNYVSRLGSDDRYSNTKFFI